MQDTNLYNQLLTLVQFSPRYHLVPLPWLRDELDAIKCCNLAKDYLKVFNSERIIHNKNESSVAFVIGITNEQPNSYPINLTISRGPKNTPPDVDLDFEARYRDEMIKYVTEKYGKDHVAQIVTFSTIKSRAAVRDSARVLGYPFSTGDKIAKSMPPVIMGRDTPLSVCFDPTSKGYDSAQNLRDIYESDPEAAEIIDVAKGLEGLCRGDGIHAAAVVITDEPITNYVPVQRKQKPTQAPEEAPTVTQYEMHGVDELGLLKMDFLGLRNLDVISDTLKMIRENHGIDLDISKVDLEDEKTFELVRKGNTIGVFQLEGSQMRNLIRALAPTDLDSLGALVALYRPGPMAANMHYDYADRKNGRKAIEYLHPDAEEILSDTQGLMIYQEKVMRIAQKFAGYSLADADLLRKAVGKKLPELLKAERKKFVDGCITQKYGKELGEKWFDIIEPFADYAFPKAHAICYGYIAYQTAYLKANYPVEYMACLLSSSKDKPEKSAIYLNECRQMGIKVLVPDVNQALSDFTTSDNQILFGMAAIRNVGEALVGPIVRERTNGTYKDFYDFLNRVDSKVLNKKAIESLIKAGSFESMGHTRKGLLQIFEELVKQVQDRRKKQHKNQSSLFAEDNNFIDDNTKKIMNSRDFTKLQKLFLEKEMLGLYVTDHPLSFVQEELLDSVTSSILDLELSVDRFVRIGGLITNLDCKTTRAGDKMATLILEDLQTSIDVLVFPKLFQISGHQLAESAIVVLEGRADLTEDKPKFIATKIELLDLNKTQTMPLLIKVNPNEVDEVKSLIVRFPGETKICLNINNKNTTLSDNFNVDRVALLNAIKQNKSVSVA